MRAKLKQKYHKLTSSFRRKLVPLSSQDQQGILVNAIQNTRIEEEQVQKIKKKVTFQAYELDDNPVNVLQLVKDSEPNQESTNNPLDNDDQTKLTQALNQSPDLTSNMRQCIQSKEMTIDDIFTLNSVLQSSDQIELYDSMEIQYRNASSHERLQLQPNKLDLESKLGIDCMALDEFIQYLEKQLELEKDKNMHLQLELQQVLQHLPPSPSTSVNKEQSHRRNSLITYENYKQRAQVEYYQMLFKKVPCLIKEMDVLQQQLDKQQPNIDPNTYEQINHLQTQLVEIKYRKGVLRNHIDLFRSQISGIIQKNNYMTNQSSQINIESWIENLTAQLEKKYPILVDNSLMDALQQLSQTLGIFLIKAQLKRDFILDTNDFMSPRSQHSDLWLHPPIINIIKLALSPVLGSQEIESDHISILNSEIGSTGISFSPKVGGGIISPRASRKESIMLLDQEQKEKDMVKSYKDKTLKMNSNYRQQIEEIKKQKNNLMRENEKLREGKKSGRDKELEEKYEYIKQKKQGIVDQINMEQELKIQLEILNEKNQWMERMHLKSL